MKQTFGISILSATALMLLSSSLLVPTVATAQERAISVQSKFKKIKVEDQQVGESVVLAETENKQQTKIQEFRVDDGEQQAESNPVKRPDRPKVKRFKVEDEEQQAETNPPQRPDRAKLKQFRVEDEEQEAADAIADDLPEVTQLKPSFKKKAPVLEAEQPEVFGDHEEAPESTFDNAEDSSDEIANPHVFVEKKVYKVRYPRRYVTYNNHRYVKRDIYKYRSNDSHPNCNNNNGY